MSHHIYTTNGFVLGSNSYGESGKFLTIFTKEIGLISGTASGIRKLSSKLRYHIQDYNVAIFSLVKGKEVWRITGAKELHSINYLSIEKKTVYYKILNLLKRFLQGEEKNEGLFDIVFSFLHYISLNELNRDQIFLIESLTVFRILYNLGYIKADQTLLNIVSDNNIDDILLNTIDKNKKEIIYEINRALKYSQM